MADPFDVWGAPPKLVLSGMSVAQQGALKRYVERVTGKAYRIGYDNGISHAFEHVSNTVTREWRAQRERMAASR